MFFEQLKAACEMRNTSVSAVALKLNISKSNVTHWKNGTMPNSEVVVRLAELLKVSTDYLLLGKETALEIQQSSTIQCTDSLEMEMLSLFRLLSDIEKAKLIGRAELLVEQDKLAENVG